MDLISVTERGFCLQSGSKRSFDVLLLPGPALIRRKTRMMMNPVRTSDPMMKNPVRTSDPKHLYEEIIVKI